MFPGAPLTEAPRQSGLAAEWQGLGWLPHCPDPVLTERDPGTAMGSLCGWSRAQGGCRTELSPEGGLAGGAETPAALGSPRETEPTKKTVTRLRGSGEAFGEAQQVPWSKAPSARAPGLPQLPWVGPGRLAVPGEHRGADSE